MQRVPDVERRSTEPVHVSTPLVLAVGLAATVFLVLTVLVFMRGAAYDTWGGVLIAPILVAVSIPVLSRQAEREGNRALFWLLLLALCLKLCGGIARRYVAFDLYEGVADASGYHNWGIRISDAFRDGHFVTGLDTLTGTDFIRFLTGLVYTVTGPTQLGGYFVFAWLGYWGLFWFYRAFTIAVPEGHRRSYAKLVFFLPSLVFWPSGIGKEAWLVFALGLGALGVARITSAALWRGAPHLLLGLWFASLVRPHMAGILGVAVAAGMLLRRPHTGLREVAPVTRVLAFAAVAALALVLVTKTDEFLRESGIDTSGGVTSTLNEVTVRSSGGGSTFAPSILSSPAAIPKAIVTVLFRPFLFEANNTQAVVAAFEGTFLILFCMKRWRWGVQAIRSLRRQAYVAFAAAYSAIFIVGFSSIANFGLLVRQRAQLLPFLLVLLTIPPTRSDDGTDEAHRRWT